MRDNFVDEFNYQLKNILETCVAVLRTPYIYASTLSTTFLHVRSTLCLPIICSTFHLSGHKLKNLIANLYHIYKYKNWVAHL